MVSSLFRYTMDSSNKDITCACGVMVIVGGNGPLRPKFKSWTKLIAFHIALIPLGKV